MTVATFNEVLARNQEGDGLTGLKAQAGKREPLRNLAPAHRARIEAVMGGGKKAPAAAPKAAPAKASSKPPAPPSFAHLAGANVGAGLRMYQEVKREPQAAEPDADAVAQSVIDAMSAGRSKLQR